VLLYACTNLRTTIGIASRTTLLLLTYKQVEAYRTLYTHTNTYKYIASQRTVVLLHSNIQ
jgi:hypothetical protein